MILKHLLDGEDTSSQGLQSRNSMHLLQSVLHAWMSREAGLGVSMGTFCTLGKKIYDADRFYRTFKVLKGMH